VPPRERRLPPPGKLEDRWRYLQDTYRQQRAGSATEVAWDPVRYANATNTPSFSAIFTNSSA